MIHEICCSPSLSLSLSHSWSQPLCDCLSLSHCVCLFCFFMPTLRYSAQLFSQFQLCLFFSFLSLLFFKPFGLARPTPCRYVSSYIHYLAVRITSTAPSFVQILSPHPFCFLFSLDRAKITIYTFDVLHHHNLDINS